MDCDEVSDARKWIVSSIPELKNKLAEIELALRGRTEEAVAAEPPIPFEADTRDALLERIEAIRAALPEVEPVIKNLSEVIEEFETAVAELQS